MTYDRSSKGLIDQRIDGPRRPQPWLDPDPLTVDPEPVDPPATSAGGLCLGIWLAALVVLGSIVLDPAPRSAPDPTSSSAVLDVRPGSASPSIPLTATSGPELSPTPQPTAVLGGFATWYADASQPADGLYGAAGPALRDALGDWRGREIRVQAGRRWTNVVLRDVCWCVDRRGRPTLLDVSPAAIAWLEPEYQRLGIVEVRVAWPAPALPATDGE